MCATKQYRKSTGAEIARNDSILSKSVCVKIKVCRALWYTVEGCNSIRLWYRVVCAYQMVQQRVRLNSVSLTSQAAPFT
jgi:hypothetical protein